MNPYRLECKSPAASRRTTITAFKDDVTEPHCKFCTYGQIRICVSKSQPAPDTVFCAWYCCPVADLIMNRTSVAGVALISLVVFQTSITEALPARPPCRSCTRQVNTTIQSIRVNKLRGAGENCHSCNAPARGTPIPSTTNQPSELSHFFS